MMRAIVVRHFKTVNNLCQRIIGWHDSPPAQDWQDDLLQTEQVFQTAGLHFDHIYSSSLNRARDTALWFANRGHGPVAVRSVPELNEVNYGELSLLSKQWALEHCPQYKTDPDYVFPGGESFAEMRRRSVSFLLSLESRHTGQTILIVAHAGVIRGLITQLLGLPYTPHLKRKISHRYLGDFRIEGQRCLRYDELGQPSGFVLDGVIELPFHPTGRDVASLPPVRADRARGLDVHAHALMTRQSLSPSRRSRA